MSIIWYLMTHYNKFSGEALVGFGFVGCIELFSEIAFLSILFNK